LLTIGDEQRNAVHCTDNPYGVIKGFGRIKRDLQSKRPFDIRDAATPGRQK
jgi:hypothetical protein